MRVTRVTGFAERVNSIPKYVASRTLEGPLDWNASLIRGHGKAPDNTKVAADLDWIAPGGTR